MTTIHLGSPTSSPLPANPNLLRTTPYFNQIHKAMRHRIQISALLLAITTTLLLTNCTTADTDKPVTSAVAVNPDFAIASPEYAALAAKALGHIEKFEYDAWGDMLAENVEYHFPDGDVSTRTKLVGKQNVLSWWKNWQMNSGIKSMTISLPNHIPVDAIKTPNMTGLPGLYVFSFFSNEMVYGGKKVALRMNFDIHFNQDKMIDRYYTYYDRSHIIEAMGGQNYLKKSMGK